MLGSAAIGVLPGVGRIAVAGAAAVRSRARRTDQRCWAAAPRRSPRPRSKPPRRSRTCCLGSRSRLVTVALALLVVVPRRLRMGTGSARVGMAIHGPAPARAAQRPPRRLRDLAGRRRGGAHRSACAHARLSPVSLAGVVKVRGTQVAAQALARVNVPQYRSHDSCSAAPTAWQTPVSRHLPHAQRMSDLSFTLVQGPRNRQPPAS